jgi:hypothetical protein
MPPNQPHVVAPRLTVAPRLIPRRLAALVSFVLAAFGVFIGPVQASAQSDSFVPRKALTVGERLTYEVRLGPIRVGRASMEVVGIEEVRGRQAWHTRFQVRGGAAFFRVNDILESWIDMETFSSLRFRQRLSEGSRDRFYEYEIYPDRATYIEKGKPERPSVSRPLDDGSFLYFLRTIPLEVGATYEFPHYFVPDRNPVRLDVTKREDIDVPAGHYQALVIRPVIKAKGVFSENGRAEVWISDDADHLLLQMKSHLKFGSLSLHLRSRTLGPAPDLPDTTTSAGRR